MLHAKIRFLSGCLRLSALLGLALLGVSVAARAEEPRPAAGKRPNVIFLFTDDQRTDTIAALGNPIIQTPNLDALVNRGFVFSNAYCMGSNVPAVCSPSRNMLLSGQTFFHFGKAALPSRPNFPTSMKQAGYYTYHQGKRGNTAVAIQALFDQDKYLNDGTARTCGEPGKDIVDDALKFLSDRKDDKPFFMYLAFAVPHDPRVAAQRYLDKYDRKAVPLPKNFLPLHPFDNGELKVRDETLAAWPRTEDEVRKHLHDYYAVITGLDENIGRLMQALKDRKLYDETLIVYSSDHGLALGSHGLMGKQSLYEHSMKAPLIFAGPGVPKGKTNAFAYLLDIFPTVCDLTNVPVPKGIDGISQAPVIRGQKPAQREVMFTAYRDVQRAVRQGPWKLIRYPQINKSQLFNLESDPDEVKNLADDPAQAVRVKELLELLAKQQALNGDKLPLTSANPKPAAVDASFFKKK